MEEVEPISCIGKVGVFPGDKGFEVHDLAGVGQPFKTTDIVLAGMVCSQWHELRVELGLT